MQTEQRPHIVSDNGAVTKTAVEASQGVKLGVMRWVLGVSLVLAIVGMVVAYWIA